MSMIRGVKDRRFRFTQTLNSMHDDPNISLKAKGFIAYCLRKPEDWVVHVKQLASVLKEGEDALYSAISECIKNGYAYRYQPRGKDGRVLKVIFSISDSKEEILERLKELEKEEEFKESLPLRGFPDPENPDPENPDPVFPREIPSAIYTNTEHKNMYKNQQHAASPNAAAFSQSKKQEQQQEPKIHECLKSVDIPLVQKCQISAHNDEETVKNAIAWATHKDNPPTKCLAASIKYACKLSLSDEEFKERHLTAYDKIKKLFKNGELYNNAECFLNKESVAFQRGMTHQQMKLDKFFSWKNFVSMCNDFSIPIPRTA